MPASIVIVRTRHGGNENCPNGRPSQLIPPTVDTDEPAWKRERDRLAARIEALEGELDRHHAALHHPDERTGLTYRTLLGELIALRAGRPGPLTLPGLRSRLSELHPSEIATIEESCAPLARFWLPAKFEDSALSVLKTFSPDQGSLDIFIAAVNDFVDAEALRSAANSETSDAFHIDNPIPIRSWLAQYEEEFRSLPPQLCVNLARWLPLFRPSGANTKGALILADLQDASAGLAALDASAHGLPASAKLRALKDAEFARAATLTGYATRPANGLGRLNPARWIARKKLRKMLATLGLPKDDAAMSNFAAAARLENALRPLRARVETASRTLFGKAADRGVLPARLAALATDIHSLLARAQRLVECIDECPEGAELERAAETGMPEAIAEFLDRTARSLHRFDARMASIAALDVAAPYFEEPWVEARRTVIESEGSNAAALGAIVNALPTLAPYQEFRIPAHAKTGLRSLVPAVPGQSCSCGW